MFEDSGDELIAERRNAEAARIILLGAGEEIASLGIGQRHVEVRTVSSAVGKRFRHECRQKPLLSGIVLGKHSKEHVPVAHRQRIRVFEVEFKLGIGVLVVKRVEVPAESIDGGADLVEPLVAVEEALHVVASLHQIVVGIRNLELTAIIELDDKNLTLNAQVEAESHRGCGGELFLQCHTGADLVGFSMKGIVRWKPCDFGIPRQLESALQIGNRIDFIIIRALAEAVERIARVEFRAGSKVLKMRDGNDFAFRDSVYVGIGSDTVFDALGSEICRHLDGVCCFHKLKKCSGVPLHSLSGKGGLSERPEQVIRVSASHII